MLQIYVLKTCDFVIPYVMKSGQLTGSHMAVAWVSTIRLVTFIRSWCEQDAALYLQTFQLFVLLQPLATERWTPSAKGLTAAGLVKQGMFVFSRLPV
jgi:hypothetical protein